MDFSIIISIVIVVIFMIYTLNHILRKIELPSENKSIFITGCDSGFGHELAIRLTNKGYTVFAGCLSEDSNLVKQLSSIDNIFVVKCDITSQSSVDGAVSYTKKILSQKNSHLWALVNNAGVAVFGDVELVPMKEFSKVFAVNVEGTVRITQALLPLLRQSKGRLVTVASLAGLRSSPGFTAYSCSKASLVALTDCLRLELKRFGIFAAAIEPGFFKTPITVSQQYVEANKQFLDQGSPETKQAYESNFDRYLDTILMADKLTSRRTYLVIEAMEHAISAKYPFRHYIVPWYVELMIRITNFFPQSIMDYITLKISPYYNQ